MVNTADKGLRLVDISLVAIYFREKSLVGPRRAPSEEDNLLRATKPKKVVCMCLDRFCGICGGIPKTTKALTA